MTIKFVALVLLCLMSGTAMAQEPKVTSLMSKDLAENPGREVLMITVEHAPGGSSAIHRHNAHAFVYVLEGSVVMQLKGGQQVTLTPGQTFYEGPDDVHVVDRNASGTNPAKFLVFLIKDKGAPALVPAVRGGLVSSRAEPAGARAEASNSAMARTYRDIAIEEHGANHRRSDEPRY